MTSPVTALHYIQEATGNYNFNSINNQTKKKINLSEDSLILEWESYVTEDGRLFYMELNTQQQQKPTQNDSSLSVVRNEFTRVSTRRSKTAGKLSKLMNRRTKKSEQNNGEHSLPEASKVTFSETSEGEVKEIALSVDPAMRHKFGRRSTLCESMLGVSTCPFPDGQRMMIANFVPNTFLANEKTAKVGDWLRFINEHEINAENLDPILLSFEYPTDIILKLQRTSDEESFNPSQNSTRKITSLEQLSDKGNLFFSESDVTDGNMVFSLMYLTMEGLQEQGAEGQDVLYCFPPKDKNCLYTSRGSFLTLNSILTTPVFSSPTITTVQIKNQTYHISYTSFNEDLLLIAILSDYATVQETQMKTVEIIRYLEFSNRILPSCFVQKNTAELNNICKIITLNYQSRLKNSTLFKRALLEPHHVPLPKEAQLRIDDALGEMESMDYREWNNDPLKSHREFFIIGSALYFKSYLLASHLPAADVCDIEAFIRTYGISKILKNQNLKDLIVWQEIYPKSVERGLNENSRIFGRWFLALIAKSQMLLAVILESRIDGSNTKEEDLIIRPSPFYIEEIQETLEHLKTGGIESLANSWASYNKRPQCVVENSDIFPSTSNFSKKTEIISILKRRNNSTENIGGNISLGIGGGSSIHSQTLSEDSNAKNEEDDDDGSDSDWDGFPDSQRSSSGFDMSEMADTLLKEVSDIVPSKYVDISLPSVTKIIII